MCSKEKATVDKLSIKKTYFSGAVSRLYNNNSNLTELTEAQE